MVEAISESMKVKTVFGTYVKRWFPGIKRDGYCNAYWGWGYHSREAAMAEAENELELRRWVIERKIKDPMTLVHMGAALRCLANT